MSLLGLLKARVASAPTSPTAPAPAPVPAPAPPPAPESAPAAPEAPAAPRRNGPQVHPDAGHFHFGGWQHEPRPLPQPQELPPDATDNQRRRNMWEHNEALKSHWHEHAAATRDHLLMAHMHPDDAIPDLGLNASPSKSEGHYNRLRQMHYKMHLDEQNEIRRAIARAWGKPEPEPNTEIKGNGLNAYRIGHEHDDVQAHKIPFIWNGEGEHPMADLFHARGPMDEDAHLTHTAVMHNTESLHPEIVNLLKEQGVKIIMDRDPRQHMDIAHIFHDNDAENKLDDAFGQTAGVHVYGKDDAGTVYLNTLTEHLPDAPTRQELGNFIGGRVPRPPVSMHEIGHAIDKAARRKHGAAIGGSHDPEFLSLYKQYRDNAETNGCLDYPHTNPDEFFAETLGSFLHPKQHEHFRAYQRDIGRYHRAYVGRVTGTPPSEWEVFPDEHVTPDGYIKWGRKREDD